MAGEVNVLAWWFLGCHRTEPPPVGDDDDDTVTPGVCEGRPDGGFCDGAIAFTCAGGDVVDSASCPDGCAGGTCVSCAALPTLPADVRLVTDPDPHDPADAWRLFPLPFDGPATVTTDGPVEVVDASGAALSGVAGGTVFLRAARDGAGAVTFGPVGGCLGDPVTVEVTAGPVPRLAGLVVPDGPGFDDGSDLFYGDREAWVDVPAHAYPDREGRPFDAWLVPHTDPPVTDLAGAGGLGPAPGTAGAPVSLGVVPNGAPWSSWDVVADFDRDGTLSPGDLARGPGSRPVLVLGTSIAAPGPHPIQQVDVNLGGQWLSQRVYWPTDLDGSDPAPLVVISHGNGHDYRWYDDLGQHLASYGYVVMAHTNNTEPGPVAASRTTVQNTDAFLQALPTFQGGALDGAVDPHAIVWIGHSRGGEGVVLAWRDLRDGQQTASRFTADDVVLISSIAPTLFEGPEQADPGPTPYHLVAGSADGDVTGGIDQSLTQYFRIFQGAESQRWVTYVEGADHNDFNCCGIDDSAWQDGRPLIGRPAAQLVSRVMHLALLEAHFHGRSELLELWTRSALVTKTFGEDVRIASLYLPDRGEPAVVEDYQAEPDPAISSSGGAFATDAREPYQGKLDDGNFTLTWQASDPMNGMSWVHGSDRRPDNGMVFGWEPGDDVSLAYDLVPAQRDVTGWDALSFRACQQTRHPATVATDADLAFEVELEDGQGTRAIVPITPWALVPTPFDRGGLGAGRGWVNEFQTVRIPLSAFRRAEPALDLSDVRAVRLWFGAAHGAPQGRLGFDDLAFTPELP